MVWGITLAGEYEGLGCFGFKNDLTFCVLALVGELLVSASMNRNGPDCFFAHSDSVMRTDERFSNTDGRRRYKNKNKQNKNKRFKKRAYFSLI